MRLGAIIEVGFRILRRHWAVLLGLALLFAGPGALLTAATGTRLNAVALDVFPGIAQGRIDEVDQITAGESERLLGALAGYLLATVAAGVLASIGALGFSAVVTGDYHARPMSLAEAIKASLRRALSALAFILVTTLVVVSLGLAALVVMLLALSIFPSSAASPGGPGAFLALVVVVALVGGVAYLSLRWAAAFPAMVAEDLDWRQALARTWHLSGDNVLRILAVIALAAIFSAVLAALVTLLADLLLVGALVPALGLDEDVASSISLAIGTVVLAPLGPVLLAVLYFDLRARRDH